MNKKLIQCIMITLSIIALFSSQRFLKNCYAAEGFLLINDNAKLYNTVECNVSKFGKPLYKFVYGEVQKKENGKLYVRIMGFLLEAKNIPIDRTHILIGSSGWINQEDAILFEGKNVKLFGDEAMKIFLQKYFP